MTLDTTCALCGLSVKATVHQDISLEGRHAFRRMHVVSNRKSNWLGIGIFVVIPAAIVIAFLLLR